jgi:hypothetical protein
MGALPVIDLGPATSTTTLGYASHSCRRDFGTRRRRRSRPASPALRAAATRAVSPHPPPPPPGLSVDLASLPALVVALDGRKSTEHLLDPIRARLAMRKPT